MKKAYLLVFAVCSMFFLLCRCSSYKYGAGEEYVQKSNLTFGIVKTKIVKDTTTQEEVLNLFGAPNMITKNRSNEEVWSYNRMSTVRKGGYTVYPFGERASASSSSQSFDLIITFDEHDVVKDYSVISTSF